MYQKLSIFQPAIFFSICLLLVFNLRPALAEETPAAEKSSPYLIQDIKSNLLGNTLSIEIIGNNPPVYTMYDMYNPARLILDIAHASLDKKVDPAKAIPENAFAKLAAKPLADQDPSITRFEITISDSHGYTVDRDKNNLLIKIHPKSEPVAAATPPETKEAAPASATSANNAAPVILQDISIKKGTDQTEILIQAGTPLKDYRHNIVVDKKDLPDMMYIDLNAVDGSKLKRETEVGTALSKIRVAPKGTGVRILFDSGLPKLFDYTVTSDPKGLLVTIKESKVDAKTAKKDGKDHKGSDPADPTLKNLIDSSTTALTTAQEKGASASPLVDDGNTFNFGGYKDAKRISVDFYKIDLHNVFRLFREISNVNIIVDEKVSGSLTLALNDVPWDFALDIILNLKNLRKEERFNTIVIYPADKAFVWPERAQDNLTVEADLEIVQQEQEALIIEQSAAQSDEMIKSKEYIRQARIEEKNNNLEKAAALYEQAFRLDPKNVSVGTHLANIYLAQLNVNAKAVYFAKESLKVEPKNTQAALYAAIGLANMNQIPEATDYFAQSISEATPMKEALISYASFSEQNGQDAAALKLIARYNTLYGESVETMVAKARIFDKTGQKEKANEQYRALLASGYQLVPGLKQYIQNRLNGGSTQTGF